MKRASHKWRRNMCGFTVTELLIAVGVVAILCALLMGAWQNVTQNSRSVQCQQHLRNLVQAGLLYAADHNGSLPDRTRWTHTTVASKEQSLLPYLGVEVDGNTPVATLEKLWVCPVAKHSEYNPTFGNRSYSINQYATGGEIGSTTWDTQVLARESPIRLINANPSKQAFFMDGTFIKDSNGKRYSVYQDSSRLTARENIEDGSWQTPFLHNGAIHVAFMDGHVERITREYAEAELIGPANPSTSQAHTSPRRHLFWGAGK